MVLYVFGIVVQVCRYNVLLLSTLVSVFLFSFSVILQPFFTIHTSSYFRMNYQPSYVDPQSPPAGIRSALPQENLKRGPPARPPPPSKPPPRSIKSQLLQQPAELQLSAEADITLSQIISNPQLSVNIPDTKAQEQRINDTPSPATGQLRPESQELLDGI